MGCLCCLLACAQNSKLKEGNTPAGTSIEGTWQILSAQQITGDSSTIDLFEGQKFIKIINKTHFSFLRHDLNKGQDSLATFVSGGGRYTFKSGKYKEHLEFCTARNWEDNHFEFDVEIRNDTLIQTGIERIEALGVDRKIIETYVLLKE